MFIDEGILSLIIFIDWLDSQREYVVFCTLFLLVLSFNDRCILSLYFGMVIWCLVFYICSFLLPIKKEVQNRPYSVVCP